MADVGKVRMKVEADTSEAEAKLERLVKLKREADAQRSGWRSSKFHLALISMAILTLVFLFVVTVTKSAAGWGEYCIALVSIAATFSGSRVAESFAAMRNGGAK